MTVHQSLAEWSSWAWPLLANHLWQSTLLSVAAFASVALLKKAPGRARYTIWLIVAAKFVVPSALLVFIAGRIGLDFPALSPSVPDSAHGYTVVYQLTSPMAQLDEGAVKTIAAARGHNELFCALTVIWFVGCALTLVLWLRRRRRFRRVIGVRSVADYSRERLALSRVKTWMGIKREIYLSVVPGTVEPGVWGVWKPTVLLPEKIALNLSDAELEAVMMHEMIHVARWDNLIANLHRVLCCLFWFNPIVWMLDRLLLSEREHACDEEVIRLGGAPEVYASSLLKVLRFCLGWSVAGASNASGSNLGRRVERIMSGNVELRFSMWHRMAVGAIAAIAIILSFAFGMLDRNYARAQTAKPWNALPHGSPTSVTDTPRETAILEVRMWPAEGSLTQGTILRWLKQVGDSVTRGEPLFEISGSTSTSINKAMSVIPAPVSGVLTQIKVKEGQTVPVDVVVALIQFNPDQSGVETRDITLKAQAIIAGQVGLIERLALAELSAVDFKNSSKSPLEITDASVKAVPRIQNEPGDEYAVVPVISLLNNSDRRIKGFTLEFRKGLERRAYYERVPSAIDGHSVYASGTQMRFIILVGGASGWTVRVAGVLFEDGDVWGVIPPPPPPPPPLPPAMSGDLMRQFDEAPDFQIQFDGSNEKPISITSASAKILKTRNDDSDNRQHYLMLPNIQVTNVSGKRVIGFGLEFVDGESRPRSYVERTQISIEPSASYSFRGVGVVGGYNAFWLESRPERLEVRLVGVKFEDGQVWGTFRASPPPPPPPQPMLAPRSEPTSLGSGKLVRKSPDSITESATHRVEPVYPPLARAARINGSVVVEVIIDEAGAVISATALSGHPLLRDAAVNAARQWQFSPTMISGVPTKTVGNLTFNFSAPNH